MEKAISRIRKRNKTNHRLEFIHTVVLPDLSLKYVNLFGVPCKVARPVMEKAISRIRKRNKTNHRLEFIHTVVLPDLSLKYVNLFYQIS